MSHGDKATRARVAGKAAVDARKVWELDVAGHRFRCLLRENGASASLFCLETRTSKGWKSVDVHDGTNDAAELLRRVCRVSSVLEALSDAIRAAQEVT